ncbi:response regulator [Candidatus Magnetomonas plexicatena]|uniref:response regulator n=1 Tax=Candidatus Magnetomonas plexicatena TaxID=2552947 RepID=UPI001C754E78|nr:response regulator [Nitrospirales bacterium LBB_01]
MQNILIVDDKVENLLVLETLLERSDLNLVKASNGKEALWKLLSDDFALVILDVHMPEMDGFEVANLIRKNKRTRTLPIIFVSASHGEEASVFRGYETGAVDYLVKPVDDVVLKSKVNIFLELDKQRQTIIDNSLQLRKANEELRLQSEILDNMSEGVILIKAADGAIVFTNPKFEQMFGYDTGELIGKNISVVNAPTEKTPAETANEIIEALNKNNHWQGEVCNIKKSGKHFWNSAHVSTFDHPKYGKVWVSIHNDITQTKKAQYELKTERDKLKRIMETMQDGVLITNKEYEIEYINDAITKEFGDVNGRKCYEYFHNETTPCLWCINEEVFSGKSIVRETFSTTNNKTYSVFETLIRNIDGSVSKFEVTHDITDIKHAQAMMKRELEFQSAVAEVSEALLSTHTSIYDIGEIIHKQVLKLTGSLYAYVADIDHKTEEVVTLAYSNMASSKVCTVEARYYRTAFPKGKDGYNALWGHSLNTKEGFYTNNPQTHPAFKGCFPPGHVPLDRFLSVPAMIGDKLIGQIALANSERDYTDEDLNIIKRFSTIFALAIERKRMEEQLNELNTHLEAMVEEETEKRLSQEQMMIQQSKMAAMGEMIGLIVHQWKQPLNAVGLTIQDLRDTYSYDELNEKYVNDTVETMMSQLIFMSKTIDDFRNFITPSKKKIRFDVNTAIEELLSMFVNIFVKNNIDVSVKADNDALLTTLGYPNEFKQVVLSILNNARDAIVLRKEHGSEIKGFVKINITNDEDKSKIVISIKDNGGGIADDIMEKIFKPYFTTKEIEGTGIGLYMSKTIIETNMGGSLIVANKNGGAEFVISLDVYSGEEGG